MISVGGFDFHAKFTDLTGVLDTFRRVSQNKLREENRRKRQLMALAEASKRGREADKCATVGGKNERPLDASSVRTHADTLDDHSFDTLLEQNCESIRPTVQNDVIATADLCTTRIETKGEFWVRKNEILRKLTAAFQTCLSETTVGTDNRYYSPNYVEMNK